MYHIKGEDQLDDLEVFKFYLGDFKLNEKILSPLRSERNPSFVVFQGRDGKYRYKDFGTGDTGDKVNLVGELFGLTHNGSLRKISQDLSGLTCFLGLPSKPPIKKKPTEIKIKIRDFSKKDLEYWSSYGINKDTLNRFQVYSISHYWINDKIIYINKNQLTYAYYLSGRFKIYSPYSEYKWITNADSSEVQGFTQLAKKGELLAITKSLKDVMSLFSFGVHAIAPQSETVVLEEDFMNKLFKRFDNIVTLFDNDETGNILSGKYWDKYKTYGLEVPKESGYKDFSDYYKGKGKDESYQLLQNLNFA